MRPRPSILWSACLMLGVMVGLSSSSAGASPSTVAPSTIDSTGGTDVTDKLMAFIASVPDGSTISFPAGARYRVEGSLIIEGRRDLTFEGNGVEFFATTEADRNRRHWWIRNSDGITIRNLVVRGANPNAGTGEAAYRSDREAQHGFDFAGATNAVLERVTVNDVYGDFVYIGLGKSGWSKNVTVRDSIFERNGRQGIAITAGEDIRIERNLISEVRRSTFDIEPNGTGWGARRVTISDNDIGHGRLNFIAGHGSAGQVDDIMVTGNRLKGKPMNVSLKAPASQRRTKFALIGNVSDTSFGSVIAAVNIDGFDGVTIRDNVLPLAAGRKMTAVNFKSTCDASVTGNQFANAVRDVNSDDYDCTKAASPATTVPTPLPVPGSTSSTTAPRPSTIVGTAPLPPESAVSSRATAAPSNPSATVNESGERDGEIAAPRPDVGERLGDPLRDDTDGGRDNAIWALVIGAVISLAVLIPVSRRRR